MATESMIGRLDDYQRRISNLERRCALFQIGFVVMCGALTLALLSGQTPASAPAAAPAADVVRAHRFVLLDPEDREVGEFGVAREDGSIRLVVRKGPGAWIGVRNDGTPAVALLSSDGLSRVILDGGEKERGLRLYTPQKEVVSLTTEPDSASTLRMFDKHGTIRVMLGTELGGARTDFSLSDEKGRERAALYVERNGRAGVGVQRTPSEPPWTAP